MTAGPVAIATFAAIVNPAGYDNRCDV